MPASLGTRPRLWSKPRIPGEALPFRVRMKGRPSSPLVQKASARALAEFPPFGKFIPSNILTKPELAMYLSDLADTTRNGLVLKTDSLVKL